MICEECCQFKNEFVLCFCDGGEMSVKRLGLVNGCTVFDSNKRCKKECQEEHLVCEEHLSSGMSRDNGLISRIFGK
jgi:hypothetical protein